MNRESAARSSTRYSRDRESGIWANKKGRPGPVVIAGSSTVFVSGCERHEERAAKLTKLQVAPLVPEKL